VEEAEEFDEVPEWVECDFTLRCKGDSMINARIYDGDTVYIRSQPEVENGEIAAVLVDDEATLKRVMLYPDKIVLEAANPMYEPLVYRGEEMNEVHIMGKAIAFTSMIR
jgi:repressor LexA